MNKGFRKQWIAYIHVNDVILEISTGPDYRGVDSLIKMTCEIWGLVIVVALAISLVS